MPTITENALLRRVNRKLAKDDNAVMKRCRENSRGFSELGQFYIVDVYTNAVTHTHCDLEVWAKDVGALAPWERLA